MKELKFGIEIEFYGVHYQKVISALRSKGIQVRDFVGYTHTVVPEWKVTTDSSVTRTNTGLCSGLELVSPILYEDEGLEELRIVYNTLEEIGAKVNKTCGTHVHFDINNYTVENVLSFINMWYYYKSYINLLVPESRRDNPYCRGLVRGDIKHLNRLESERRLRDIHTITYVLETRYRTVNLDSYRKYGTIEIRQHGGTLNFEKMEAWIVLIHQMLDYSYDNKVRVENLLSINKRNGFNQLLEQTNLNNSYIGDFLTSRFEHFRYAERVI